MLMVQSKPQGPGKSGKMKPPPPVPPRPNQSVVAEALAKTRKAVADSKLTKSRPATKDEPKAKTLERTGPAGQSPPNVSPKLNGLARVKSFIRDVISDRSSSEDKKSGGTNSRRSSTENSSIPAPVSQKSAPEQKSSIKTIKSCRQALVRSLSTSTKLEQDSKNRALKSSSSFAEKTLPLRKAPPPPLSPKPKLREVKPVCLPKRNSLEIVNKPKVCSPVERPPQIPPKSPPKSPTKLPPESPPRSPPINIPKSPPESPVAEAPYATVDEVTEFDNRLSSSPEPRETSPAMPNGVEDSRKSKSPPPNYTNSLERKTSRVTERLISEIIASKNKPFDSNTVIDKGKPDMNGHIINGDVDSPEEKMPKDMNNHEMLIYELQTMRSQSHVPKNGEEIAENSAAADDNDKCSSGRSSRAPSIDLSETSDYSEPTDPNTCDADDPLKSRLRKQFRAISSMSLQGLPPLPKSLSGFAEGPLGPEDDSPPTSPLDGTAKPADMDSQLALLKKEMASLRRLDLSLLSELWSLNEAMASWRQQLERAPRLRPAPPPPPHYLRT